MVNVEISPSLMCMDMLQVNQQIAALDKLCDSYHLDIMDGHYVKNFALSFDWIKAVKSLATKPLHLHLMVIHPQEYLEACARAGASSISPQYDTIVRDAFRTVDRIHDLGCEAGVVLNPAEPVALLEPFIERLDRITLMTVDPGYAGQRFIPEVLQKITALRKIREARQLHFCIEIDGSCNRKTYHDLVTAGAEILIVGTSGLFGLDEDVTEAWHKMQAELEAAC